MGYVERLTIHTERYAVELAPDWRRAFEQGHPSDPVIRHELLSSIEGWLTTYVVLVQMQRDKLARTKHVRIALGRMRAGLDGLKENPGENTRKSAIPIFTYRTGPLGPAARGYNVALDWVAYGLLGTGGFKNGALLDQESAERHLVAALGGADGLASLRHSVLKQSKFFGLDDAERLARLEAVGLKLDPRQLYKSRPEQAAVDILSAALREIYRCTGAAPFVPKDGRESSPFLRFLGAARDALPHGYRVELVSPARRAQEDERKNGPGTLERAQSKQFHPECWVNQ